MLALAASATPALATRGGGALLIESCKLGSAGSRSVFFTASPSGRPARRIRRWPSLPGPIECGFRYPTWAPDGRRYVYMHGGRIAIKSTAAPRARPRFLAPRGLWPAWSPDGSHIAFVIGVRENVTALAVVPASGGRVRRILASRSSIEWPSWSADGRYILYSTNRVGDPGQIRMWRIPSSGGRPRLLGRGRSIDQAPDGRLAFITGTDVWTARADGTRRRRIVDHPAASMVWRLAWSPDGSRIAYVFYPFGNGPEHHVRIVRRDGRRDRRVRLPRHVDQPLYVHWGPG